MTVCYTVGAVVMATVHDKQEEKGAALRHGVVKVSAEAAVLGSDPVDQGAAGINNSATTY